MSAISHLIPSGLRRSLRERLGRYIYGQMAYSQEGEDLVLRRLFESQASGVYVDVGAHHPYRFSNTYLLYARGWRGINIDALPGSMVPFRRSRPRDISLEIGVGETEAELTFCIFHEPALNTFDATLAEEREREGWPIKSRRSVQCLPLARILDRELPRLGTDSIDLLTIDVEGLDLQVLRSNDWSRYRPRVIVVEVLDEDLGGVAGSDVGRFCADLGYRPFAKLHHTVIFVRD